MQNFDELWHNCLHNHTQMIRQANSVVKAARLFRRHAYGFAANLLLIRTHYHNEFLNMVRSTGVDLDAWMDDHFSVVEQMGDDRARLLSAIESGCTEKEYVQNGTVWLVRKKTKAPNKPIESPPTLPPPETATIEERFDHLHDMFETLKSKHQGLRHENRTLRADLARVLSENTRLTRALKTTERAIEPVLKNR